MFKNYSSFENQLETYIMAWKANILCEKQEVVDQMIYDLNCMKINYACM